jgi:hypothetical protein
MLWDSHVHVKLMIVTGIGGIQKITLNLNHGFEKDVAQMYVTQ